MSDFVPMHVEHTDNLHVLRWVVRNDVVQGNALIHSNSEQIEVLPEQWIDYIAFGVLESVRVTDGALLVTRSDETEWASIAATLQSSLATFFADGGKIQVETEPVDDVQLAAAVEQVLAGPLADYVAGHGGKIELDSVVDGVVTVRLIGACQGCPSSGTTLKAGIEEQLREQFPQIVEVRAEDAPSHTSSLLANGRKFLPLSVK